MSHAVKSCFERREIHENAFNIPPPLTKSIMGSNRVLVTSIPAVKLALATRSSLTSSLSNN